jgi:hypothetical protein
MSRCPWIICERGSRWAPALRTALTKYALKPAPIHEVRSLAELGERIDQRREAFVFIEVTSANFGAALSWLATRAGGASNCRFFAGLDRSLVELSAVAAALREAGAIDVLKSPRQMQSAIRLGFRHGDGFQRAASCTWTEERTIEAWARSLLPWQAAP